jgi:hypothetical protein
MPDEAAVLESPEVEQIENVEQEPTESTGADDGQQKEKEEGKQDNRHQPDALKKHIADLRRRADSITDPIEKKEELDRIKFLYDTSGKARGYEQQFPTVREAREVRALLEAVGGREGVRQMQATLSEIEQVDQALSAGDPNIVDRMWEEAPDGMPKLMPALLDKFAQAKPQEYAKAIMPHTLETLEKNGFMTSIEAIYSALENGDGQAISKVVQGMKGWFDYNRQLFKQEQQKQTDPEVERLRAELAKRDEGNEAQKVDAAYNDVITHASPTIDKVARPIIGKFGFSKEENAAFKNAVWNHLQESRNSNADYKTIAPEKQRQGYDKWTEYAKRWTDDNAEASIRAVLKTPPWSRLASVKTNTTVTKSPTVANVQKGQEPLPGEIDYGPNGKMAARKAGFKDLSDMILEGQAPLKTGGIRKWR